jgi:hypothetical protein
MRNLIFTTGMMLAIFFFTDQLAAQNEKAPADQQQKVVNANDSIAGRNFIDANNNGICDRFENNQPAEKGPNFVDADKNGICDHRENGTKGNGQGFGYRHRHGQRNGQCCGRGPCGGKGWKNR